MTYEPRGKMIELVSFMRAKAGIFKSSDVAAILCCKNFPSTIDQYLYAAVAGGAIFKRKSAAGDWYYKASAITDEDLATVGAKPQPDGGGLGPRLIASPAYSREEIAAARADVRAPKDDPAWHPPVMTPPRGTTAPVAEPQPPAGKREEKLERIRADIATEMEPRGDRANRVLVDKLRERMPGWAPPSAPPPETTVSNAPQAAPALAEASIQEGASAEEEPEVTWSLWEDGDLDLHGLQELDNGSHRLPAEALARLRKFVAWMPA